MKIIRLEEVGSTNDYAAAHASELDQMTMILAHRQTSGRGQRGNSWESEPGKNLTFTLFFKPLNMLPREQFAISEAAALGIADYLRRRGIDAKVKWPNDIYAGNRKIAGILIEHSVSTVSIDHSRIGIGLNVNQTEFRSDAPNPVSMSMITGAGYDLDREIEAVGDFLGDKLALTSSPEGRENLHKEFLSSAWRLDGNVYPFRRKGDTGSFAGIIRKIGTDGMLGVEDTATGVIGTYAFKEIIFL